MKNIRSFYKLFFLLFIIISSCQMPENKSVRTNPTSPDRAWWKEAVVYQIYPRSFQDTDGDGVGDLKGIISRLDYVKSLGIDVVWLNPIYASPNDDNGYDISDYRDIMKEFGTMEDFDNLLNGMHNRGIRLVMDLVVNHCSSEHEWFRQARSSHNNPYRDYFHWWPAEKGKPAKRYSFFDVNNDAWKYDSLTDAYYLHYFSVKQPDLNWENPKVRKEIYDMMRFWFDKGVDGFRMDVIPFISKDTIFPELPAEYNGDMIRYYANGPFLHDYLREMNREVLSKYDIMTVAEGAGVTYKEALDFVDPEHYELNMAYHFDGMNIGYLPDRFKVMNPEGYSLLEFKKVYSLWDSVFAEKGWGTIYLGNHDQPRMVTRWGNDSPEFRELSSKMLTTFLLTMRGTPYYYFGDELGMANIKFDKIGDYRDIESINMYQQVKNNNGDLQAFLEAQKISARDNGRTPFQWDDSPNAGFTNGTPWLKVNPDYSRVNAAIQENDPNSVLNYFRRLVSLRKHNLTLVYGQYALLDKNNPDVYCYSRNLNNETIIVMLNFRDKTSTCKSGIDLNKAEILIHNYPEPSRDGRLKPYEAIVYKLNLE
jgi:oligo-1,6-glucosidase